jgi:transformation system protein
VKTKVNKYLVTGLNLQEARKNTKNTSSPTTKKAFTMIELIFVIIIIGTLAAIAVPRLNVGRQDADVVAAFTNIQNTIEETQQYFAAHGNGKYYLQGDEGTGLHLKIGGTDNFFDDSLYDADSNSYSRSASMIYYYFPGEDMSNPHTCMFFGVGNMQEAVKEPKYGIVIWYNHPHAMPAGQNPRCDKLRNMVKEAYPPNGIWSGSITFHVIEFGYRKGAFGNF